MTMTTITIPAELLTQRSALQTQLEEIAIQEAALIAQKSEVEISLKRIDQVVRLLNGEVLLPVVAQGARRPMSEQARENIRQGLIRAAAKKREAAAQVPAATPEITQTASVAVPVAATVNDEPQGVSGANAAGRLAVKKAKK